MPSETTISNGLRDGIAQRVAYLKWLEGIDDQGAQSAPSRALLASVRAEKLSWREALADPRSKGVAALDFARAVPGVRNPHALLSSCHIDPARHLGTLGPQARFQLSSALGKAAPVDEICPRITTPIGAAVDLDEPEDAPELQTGAPAPAVPEIEGGAAIEEGAIEGGEVL